MNNLTFRNVDSVCAAIDRSRRRPVIDLSEVEFFEPFALVYLGMFLRHYNAQGIGFDVTPPRNDDARNYLTRQRFWDRFNFDPRALPSSLLRRMTTSSSLNDIVDIEPRSGIVEEIADAVIQVLHRNHVPVDLSLTAEMVSELVDNFAQHAQGPLAAFTMQVYRRGARRFVLAIGDCGIGIRASLSTKPKYSSLRDHRHAEAAVMALRPMVSRRSEGGTGLWEVQQGVRRLGGILRLATGDGYVRIPTMRYAANSAWQLLSVLAFNRCAWASRQRRSA